MRDPGALQAALSERPECNWGLATGIVSGCWALDYDPKAVDPVRQAEVDAVLAQCWAAAAWVQRTGSGGLHFLFALPEDFVPNNGSGRLPPGFDVRGSRRGQEGGGQIVVAPSVSGVGPYEVLRDAGGLGPAPVEVLAAVRPVAPRAASTVPLPLATVDQNAVTKYVVAAVVGELDDLRATWVQRNQRAWRAAARCIEMINTGMIRSEPVYAAWWAAAQAHPDRTVSVPDVELLSVWSSAERHVGDRPADLSGVGGPAGWWGGDVIRPTSAPSAPVLGGGPGPGAGGAANSYPQGVHGPVDSRDGRYDDVTNGVTTQVTDVTDPVTALIARMLTPEQLDERPNPVPLINGVLDLATTAWLIGRSGSGKSFVALDVAAHVGLGVPWRGHAVTQGLVVYVVAEGDQGMKLRQAAWRREYGGTMKDVLFLPEPVQADERRTPDAGQWSILVAACRRLRPVLVIIDTQARVTIGLNENDNGDMSYYAEQADRIKRATGACVLTVHHMGRTGGDARGASALDGAQDAELKVERTGMQLKLTMDKQKDQAEAPPMTISLRRSEGGVDPATGRDLSSLVLDPGLTAPALGEGSGVYVPEGTKRARALYQAIRDTVNHGEGGTRAALRALLAGHELLADMKPNTRSQAATRAWNDLVSLGLVIKRDRRDLFKVLVLDDQGPDGVLTPNGGEQVTDAPEGWSVWWPGDEQANKHADDLLKRTARRLSSL